MKSTVENSFKKGINESGRRNRKNQGHGKKRKFCQTGIYKNANFKSLQIFKIIYKDLVQFGVNIID